jgi:predicted RND superfamily exporter protein
MNPTLIEGLMAKRWWVLGVLVAMAAALGPFAARVGIDNAVEVWFVDGDPALKAYREFQRTFGNDEVVALAVVDEQGMWRASPLNTLNRLTTALEGVDGVAQVHGLPRARLINSALGSFEVRTAMTPKKALNKAEIAALKKDVEADPLLKGRLVLAGGTVAMLYAQMEVTDNFDARRPEVLDAIREAVSTHLTDSGMSAHIAGIGVVYDELNRISQTEGVMLMGAAFALIFIFLWPLFRSFAAVMVAVGSVSLALTMTRGLYGLTGHDENMVTMTLPVLVLIIGVADCIHILRYRAGHPDQPAATVLAEILRPCLFTTLTTVVGFASLGFSKMAVVRDLGLFAAAGIAFAFVCSAGLCIFALSYPNFSVKPPSSPTEGWGAKWLKWTARVGTGHKETVLAFTLLLLLASAVGVSRIKVDTYSMGFLKDSNEVRRDSEYMEKIVGPTTPLELVVDTGKQEAIADNPAWLRGIAAYQQALKAHPQIRDVFSLADVVARIHQVNGGPGTAFEVPDDAAMLGQDLELYWGTEGNQLASLTDSQWQKVRITALVPMLSARQYRKLINEVTDMAVGHLPSGAVIQPSGYLPLYVRMMDYIVESQVVSFGVAFIVVFFLIGLLFRSLTMAALSVLPNVLPVFVILGVMGFCKINLDVATVTITAILIGIVVDDTIHYLHRFRSELELADGDFDLAAEKTALSAGRAILSTSIIFSLGFLILAFASVKSIVYFGLLTGLAMVVALLADMLIMPAILKAFQPRLSKGE